MNQREEEYWELGAYSHHEQNHHQKLGSGAIIKESFPIIKSSLTEWGLI